MTLDEKVAALRGWPFYALEALEAHYGEFGAAVVALDRLAAAATDDLIEAFKRIVLYAERENTKLVAASLAGMSTKKRDEWIKERTG